RRSAMRRIIGPMLVLVLTTCLPARSVAQAPMILQQSATAPAPSWELSLEGRVGLPAGYIRVSETVTHGTRLRLGDLGLDVSEAEDFYLPAMPVPILGLRFDYPLTRRLGLRASVAGGLLPKVDSLRTEGGTVYTWQSHADAGLAVTYAVTPRLGVEAGYQYTYFHQHEKSHEDDNVFELIDHGLRARLTLRF